MVPGKLKRILITGASGFIGKHLLNHFAERYETYGLARDSAAIGDVRGTQVVSDVRHLIWEMTGLPDTVDYVLHCAALTSHRACQDRPDEAFDINVTGTLNLLEQCQGRVGKFIYFSTGDVYGYHENAITENTPVSPIDIYSETKLAAELALDQFRNRMPIQVLRLFHVYGKGMSSQRMIPRFIRMIEARQRAHCGPDGQPILSLTHVDDLVKYVDALLGTPGCETLNVAGNELFSVADIYEILAKQMGVNLKCEIRKDHLPGNLIADRRKLLALTGIEADRSLRTSCEELIAHELVC